MKIRTLAAALAAAALAVAAPAAAHASTPHDSQAAAAQASAARTPTAAARAAGITSAGGGYMGWSQHSTHSTAPAGDKRIALTAHPDASGNAYGIDVASYQGNVDWASYKSQGKTFAYMKATENTNYTNPYFSSQYTGSYNNGFVRGAYHFAIPNGPSAASQADYFFTHGGGWSADGQTLPGALDIEYNPYGATCYGLSQSAMVSWISAWLNEYHAKSGRWAVIYSTTDWWTSCTGNSSAFAGNDPLWIARYSSSAGTLPAGWGYYTIWQYADSPVDEDVFNGDQSRVVALANNS